MNWFGRPLESPALESALGPALLPLTAQFDAGQHEEYVQRLTAVLTDNSIRNVALTGRYGAGKSSVLNEFSARLGSRVLNLSLSTLGSPEPTPGSSETSTSVTNRIQKELVKQLLHSRTPRALPYSRFRRITPPSRVRATASSAVILAIVGGLAALLGLFPKIIGTSSGHPLPLRVLAFSLFSALALAVLTCVRLAVRNREVASVSAAGTSITLAERQVSYFDQYLDEIVYFFAGTQVDVVLFEDLDRFNDPHIFEALRELNALLNTSRQVNSQPIRFVYALKDSIFEQLGHDADPSLTDAAEVETVRGNRTKFFDLVIPIVPFITHRTSRDLLSRLLSDPSLMPVAPELVDLTARHITDMRSLKNIRNEYAIFSSRLVTRGQGVTNLRPESLFAMMVYKSFHLGDFEQVQVGRSDLDKLYRQSRVLVRESIAHRQKRLHKISDGTALSEELVHKAAEYGTRLTIVVEQVRTKVIANYQVGGYIVGGESFAPKDAFTDTFWRSVFSGDQQITASFASGHTIVFSLLHDLISIEEWETRERRAVDAERERISREISAIRRASFGYLMGHPEFRSQAGDQDTSFDAFVTATLKSEVARELVRHGYIDQNFALYVAQYYGTRLSTSALNFIVQHIQPNISDPHYTFDDSSTDIEAVLRETNSEFLDQESAYNTAVLDHLLAAGNPESTGAAKILDRVTRVNGRDESTFLALYLSTGTLRNEAIRYLAKTWSLTFIFLIDTADLAPDHRLALVDYALATAIPDLDYSLNTKTVTGYLQDNQGRFACLTDPLSTSHPGNIALILERAHVTIGDLAILSPGVRECIIEIGIYDLSAANLSTALQDPHSLSLDYIRVADERVFRHCLDHPSDYLMAVTSGPFQSVTIDDAAKFPDVLQDIASWDGDLLVQVLDGAASGCVIVDLKQVPASTWPALAQTRRFTADLYNVQNYLWEFDVVDGPLGTLLVAAQVIEDTSQSMRLEVEDDTDSKQSVGAAILNASSPIPSTSSRVKLVASLKLNRPLPAGLVPIEQGPLLSELLEEKICDESHELFVRFSPLTWETLRPALPHAPGLIGYADGEILSADLVEKILADPAVATEMKVQVIERLDDFVAYEPTALLAAARFAESERMGVSNDQLARIAAHTGDADVTVKLLALMGESVPASQAINALAALGGKYAGLTTSGAHLTLPNDDDHQAVLSRLKSAGLLEKVAPRRTVSELNVTVA